MLRTDKHRPNPFQIEALRCAHEFGAAQKASLQQVRWRHSVSAAQMKNLVTNAGCSVFWPGNRPVLDYLRWQCVAKHPPAKARRIKFASAAVLCKPYQPDNQDCSVLPGCGSGSHCKPAKTIADFRRLTLPRLPPQLQKPEPRRMPHQFVHDVMIASIIYQTFQKCQITAVCGQQDVERKTASAHVLLSSLWPS